MKANSRFYTDNNGEYISKGFGNSIEDGAKFATKAMDNMSDGESLMHQHSFQSDDSAKGCKKL